MAEEIVFKAQIGFKGSIEEFQKVAADLQKLTASGKVAIDTVPLPDKPTDKTKVVMIDTVPLPELKFGGWTIEGVTVHPKPYPGFPPPEFLGDAVVNSLVKDMPRIKINKEIYGGMRNPHLHIKNEIVLLNKERFKELVGQVVTKLSKELLK
jgi:hypothetical protein